MCLPTLRLYSEGVDRGGRGIGGWLGGVEGVG